ncbi:MAG: ATP-grasp domain-containing protein [Phycisphaerae bacterium]|jgi:carbamoyl-phosphate synthase large subunit
MQPGAASRITLLFSCVGRRVELLQAFRAAARRLNVELRLVGTDIVPTAPGLACVDEAVLTPKISEPDYVPALLEIIRRTGARALVPTIDTDLPALSENRATIQAAGCLPLVAEPAVIRYCFDKYETCRILRAHGIDTPMTWSPEELGDPDRLTYPYFLKPRQGSASIGARKLTSAAEYAYHVPRLADPILQEFVEGDVYTLDAYTGLSGQVRCIVPRLRLQVRTGEVVKGVVVKDREIMAAGKRCAEVLGPTALGMITLQCIVTRDRRIRFVDINPRFGGGAPLGIAAGADYPGWLLRELRGEQPEIAFDGFRHGLCMSRYDWSVFTQLDDDVRPRLAPALNRFPDFDSRT